LLHKEGYKQILIFLSTEEQKEINVKALLILKKFNTAKKRALPLKFEQE